MALVESNMLPIATKAPDFTLPNVITNSNTSLSDVQGENGLVVMFICNHCPFVIYVNHQLVELANEYMAKGIGFVAISSNDVINYPQDAPDKMVIHAKENNYPFPYLYDASQSVAKSYDAACTPDIYVFDKSLNLHYRGRIDSSRPGNDNPQDSKDIINALDNMLGGGDPPSIQYPSAGCNIKWLK
jgi:peroxiredoxin